MSDSVLHIYCDESRQCVDRYMVIGGLIINSNNIDPFNKTMEKFREEENMKSELKWSKVTNQKLKEYKRFVDFFFALNNTDKLHFKSIVVDNHKADHKKHSGGDKELSFQKFYYQLILHKFGKYFNEEKDTKIILHPDRRNSKYSLDDFKDILNRGLSKKIGRQVEPFVSIEPKDSKESEPVQINDIILGAIGFQKNGYHLLADSRKAKIELADYIAKSAGYNDLIASTPYGKNRFEIWNLQFKKE